MTTVDRSRLMTAVAATILLAAILLAETQPTEAAFPGSNGRIVFASGQEIAGGTEGDTDIFTMNPDGTGLTQLTGDNNVASDGDPAFSPDGSQIAFVKQTGIWVMKTDGTSQRFVVGIAEPAVARPAFSPDGTKLAYVCNAEAGNRDVCTVNLDGTEQTRITTHPKDDVEPAWSPDGTRIAFASTRDEAPGTQNYDVFTMDADGSDPINLTNRPPDAADDTATIDEDSPVTLNALANDSDPDGHPLTLASNTQPVHGSANCTSSGECTYTPTADYNGPDSFGYTVDDGSGGTDTGTVNLTVNSINDPPVADDLDVTTDEDSLVDITLAASDAEDDALDYSVVGRPDHGTLTGTRANRTYTPDQNYNGSDSFTFGANDGSSDSNLATAMITIRPVNDAPAITDISPAPGSDVRDRAPTITATVGDVETDLVAGQISLFLDGRARNFFYDHANDRLNFTPNKKLSFGGHTVRIVARDGAGLSTTENWSFRLARR